MVLYLVCTFGIKKKKTDLKFSVYRPPRLSSCEGQAREAPPRHSYAQSRAGFGNLSVSPK